MSLNKKITISAVFSVILLLTFSSCNSTKVENSEPDLVAEYSAVHKEDLSITVPPSDHEAFDKFIEMYNSGTYTIQEVADHLDNWNIRSPYDPELAQCYFIFFMNFAPFNEKNASFYFNAIGHLQQALEFYPDRYDLWSNYIYALGLYNFFDEGAEVIVDFLDTVVEIENKDRDLYNTFFEKIVFDSDTAKENFIISEIINITYKWICDYPLDKTRINACEKILNKLLVLYPDNYVIYNELGLSYLDSDPRKALPYFNKAIELNPSSYESIINAILCTINLNDSELFEKYYNYVYESGDQDLIDCYEESIKNLINNKTKS